MDRVGWDMEAWPLSPHGEVTGAGIRVIRDKEDADRG